MRFQKGEIIETWGGPIPTQHRISIVIDYEINDANIVIYSLRTVELYKDGYWDNLVSHKEYTWAIERWLQYEDAEYVSHGIIQNNADIIPN